MACPAPCCLLCVLCRYGVGGLSVLNACAGCYSEDLPVIFVSGVRLVQCICIYVYVYTLHTTMVCRSDCDSMCVLGVQTVD